MFSDRIRVAETVCNETENYGKDDNWMGISNCTYRQLEHKQEKRRGREKSRQGRHLSGLETQYNLGLSLSGFPLQFRGLASFASPFSNFL